MSHKLVSLYIGDGEYYTRIDADAVIAELKEKHKTEVKELLCLIRDKENNFNRAFDSEEKEIRHHKYTRCLAMYRYCSIKALYELDFKGNDVEWKWYSKWMHKWFELAKQFKEGI